MSIFAVIDLANMFFRMSFATQGDAYTKAGMALHIVFRSLRKLYIENNADHIVFCCEGRSWRYDVFPQYKASRKIAKMAKSEKEKEDDLVFFEVMNQFTDFVASKTRCTVLQSQGVEGDDFVARWVQLHPNDSHIIVSGDSDFVQLIADNVKIYDGVNDRFLTKDGVIDSEGKVREFTVKPSDGKIKVGAVAAKDWVPESEWHRKALFVKLLRGDSGDGIFSAYPGVRFKGSAKKMGIQEAWDDRHERGYGWNNFFLQTWDKIVGTDEDGAPIKKPVLVLDEYRFNESLIDLTKQPQDIKDLMDTVIVQAVQKESVSNVGYNFLRFCHRQNLPKIAMEATDHTKYLNAPYSGDA